MSELRIDPDEITRYVSQQIARSALGEKLRQAIDEEIEKLKYGRSSEIFKPLVSDYIQKAAREYLDTSEIQVYITQKVNAELTTDAIDEMVTGAIQQMRSRRY
jgi:metal-responsive CopG/Arc/MetJ family transcriptional regulator